jgi:hypothetical protein
MKSIRRKKGWRARREYWAAQPVTAASEKTQSKEAQGLEKATDRMVSSLNNLDAFLAILPHRPDNQD